MRTPSKLRGAPNTTPPPSQHSFTKALLFVPRHHCIFCGACLPVVVMKTSILLAAGSLMGAASAGVHKMKLKKVPLSEQLVSHHCIRQIQPALLCRAGAGAL